MDPKSAVFRPLWRYLCVFLVPGPNLTQSLQEEGLLRPAKEARAAGGGRTASAAKGERRKGSP